MPHRRDDKLVLAAEIVMGEGGRDACLAGDLAHRHLEGPACVDSLDRGVDQGFAADWFHSDLGHGRQGPFAGDRIFD